MTAYGKGLATKQHIIDLARQMFWEKGYVGTYYKDFATEGDINPGLIHYYFKKKETLGRIIYLQLIRESTDVGRNIAGEGTDPLLKGILNILLCWRWIDVSPQYARFAFETAQLRIPVRAAQTEDIYYFSDFLSLGGNVQMIQRSNRLAAAVENELFLSLMEGFSNITPEECAYLDARNAFTAIGCSHAEVDAAFGTAQDILSQFIFSVSHGFALCYSKK